MKAERLVIEEEDRGSQGEKKLSFSIEFSVSVIVM